MNLIERVKGIILTPKTEWPIIAAESGDTIVINSFAPGTGFRPSTSLTSRSSMIAVSVRPTWIPTGY